MMPTGEQILQDLLHPAIEARRKLGITHDYLARKHKQEMNAKATKTLKVKGAVGNLPRGYRHVLTTGFIEKHIVDGELERDYVDGESVITWDEALWDIRQKGRMDADKMEGSYPAAKQAISLDVESLHGVINAVTEVLPPELRGPFSDAIKAKFVAEISGKRD